MALLTRIGNPDRLNAETLAYYFYWFRPDLDPSKVCVYLPFDQWDDAKRGALIARMQFVLDELKGESILL